MPWVSSLASPAVPTALKGEQVEWLLGSPAAGPGYHSALWGCLCDLSEAELQTDSEDGILCTIITGCSPDDAKTIFKF